MTTQPDCPHVRHAAPSFPGRVHRLAPSPFSSLTRCSLLLVSILILLLGSAQAVTYSSNPAVGTYKDVGAGFRMRVTAIVGSNVTFEITRKGGGNFGSAGRAVIREGSTTGATRGTGAEYAAGAATAGTIIVNMAAIFANGARDFYCVRQFRNPTNFADDLNVWDGPITITATNTAPVITGFAGVMRADRRLDFNYTATDSDGLGYVGVYIVNNDQSVNANFTLASEVGYNAGLASGAARTLQPWSAAQLQGWLTAGTQYRLRMKAIDLLNADSGWVYSPSFTYTGNPSPVIAGFTGVMRADRRLDFNYTATDSDGLGYVGVYIVNNDQSVNANFTLASEVGYNAGLASGAARTLQPWTAAQLQGWLTAGTQYRLRMKAIDLLNADSNWVYSPSFTYTGNPSPVIAGFTGVMRADRRLDFNYTATDSDGLGYVGVYIVNNDQSVNANFTLASEVGYNAGLASGAARTLQPWTAAQLQGWLTVGTQYRLRMKAIDLLNADSNWVYSPSFTYTGNPPPVITGFTGVMRADRRLDFNYTATDSDGLGYAGVYIVNNDQTVNANFTLASEVGYSAGLVSGSARTLQPWTAAQLQGWLTVGTQYRLRMKAIDLLNADSNWVYSPSFTYTGNPPPVITGFTGVMRPDGRLDFNYTATDPDGLGYVGVYIVNNDNMVNTGFTAASEVGYTTGLGSGVARTVQPWTAAQLLGWLVPNTPYRLRMKAQDGLTSDSAWVYSPSFTYVPGTVNQPMFSFPMGDRRIYTAVRYDDGWYNAQEFGTFNTAEQGHHLGEDWNGDRGGDTDCNEPLFAIGDGTVHYAQNGGAGWSNVVILRHTIEDGSQVESLYGHLARMDVAAGAVVTRGQQIGLVGKGRPQDACHLHLEIRTSNCPDWGTPGPGYSATARPAGWLDPSDFIAARNTVQTGVLYTLHRVGDTSGTMHSSNPGATKTVFTPGQTVRVTLKATNTGTATATYAMCNARNAATEVTVYRSPKNAGTAPADTPIGGGVAVTGGNLNNGQTAYYSFDISTSNYAEGAYDLSGNLRQTATGPGLDSTAAGIGDLLDSTWWQNRQFIVSSSPASGAAGTILGVDVSRHNGTVDWGQLAAQGVRFAWARSTLGNGITDNRYTDNAAGATAAGITFGAYHFAYPVYTGGANTAVAEAQWFVSVAGSRIGPGFLPPALDVENDHNESPVISSLTTAALTDWVLAWCREVQRLTGVRPIVYMNSSFASSEVDSRLSAEFPLWVANYGTNSGTLNLSTPPATGVWSSWSAWQFTSRGVMAGNGSTYIDRNVFNGDEAAFQQFVGGGDPPVAAATDAMLALNRTVPPVMSNISIPNNPVSHYEARSMVQRIMVNFLGRALSNTELQAISSAVPPDKFGDASYNPGPVLRQEVFKMLTGALESIKGYVRPSAPPPNMPDLPASGWQRDVVLSVYAWDIAGAEDLVEGNIRPSMSVARYRFARWAARMMDVLLNPPVPGPTPAMAALAVTTPAIMPADGEPRQYLTHREARLMVRSTAEYALGRVLTAAELLNISDAQPFDSVLIGLQHVSRREAFKMLLACLEPIAGKQRPAGGGITLEDLPASGWQREAILGCNAWSLFDAADTPSSEIYESARVSRYIFAKWDYAMLSLLGAPGNSFAQWIAQAGFMGPDAAPDADPDGDGIGNFLEFASGSSPGQSSSVERQVLQRTPNGNFEFTFRRSPSRTMLTYEVLISSDTINWSPVARSTAGGTTVLVGTGGQSVTDPGGALPSVTVRLHPSPTGSLFVRLRVIEN